jgi:hypothetical protein
LGTLMRSKPSGGILSDAGSGVLSVIMVVLLKLPTSKAKAI